MARAVPAWPSSGGSERSRPWRGRRGRLDGDALAREAGAYVIGTGRAADRQAALDFGANEFVDLDSEPLEDVGEVDLVFDLIGGDIRSGPQLVRAGGMLVTVVGRRKPGPPTA